MPDLLRNADTVGSVPSLAWTTGPELATSAVTMAMDTGLTQAQASEVLIGGSALSTCS
jgi:hypothetical protein